MCWQNLTQEIGSTLGFFSVDLLKWRMTILIESAGAYISNVWESYAIISDFSNTATAHVRYKGYINL